MRNVKDSILPHSDIEIHIPYINAAPIIPMKCSLLILDAMKENQLEIRKLVDKMNEDYDKMRQKMNTINKRLDKMKESWWYGIFFSD